MGTERRALWDAPVRLFHWALAVLVVFSYVTGKIGGAWMEWHLRSGYAILTLLLFRLAWGFAGGTAARFASFVRGPRAALDYGRSLLARERPRVFGHNPLGGWMVLAMLAILLLQAATGLFSDDEIRTQGPLAAKVSEAAVQRLSTIHVYNQWVVLGVAILHVVAIATYHWLFRIDLVRPMISGHGEAGLEVPPASRPGSRLVALLLFGACAGFVYWLVVIFPRTQ